MARRKKSHRLGSHDTSAMDNEHLLKRYGKCLRKCKRKPHVGACIDACLETEPVHGLGVKPYWRPKGERSRRGGDYDDFTEADEGATSLTTALRNYEEKLVQYAQGEETMGVLTMYENAAVRAGASHALLEKARAHARQIVGPSGRGFSGVAYDACVTKCLRKRV